MPKDPARAGAARLATLVALPVALLVLLGSLWWNGARNAADSPATSAPQATSPVEVPVTPLPEPSAAVCRAVVAKLPTAVRAAARRPVTAAGNGPEVAERAAAYGDPAIVLTCGAPAVSDPSSTYFGLSGVCWHAARPSADTTVWTTVDRQVPIRVTVPSAYEAPGQWVINFSAPIAAADPPLANPPSGCVNAPPSATAD